METERYGEAMELLEFLLRCQGESERYKDEWTALLEWMRAEFPDAAAPPVESDEEDEAGEAELMKRHIQEKIERDSDYVAKTLESVTSGPLTAQKLLALEQLTYFDHPQIDDTLKRWLKTEKLHPLQQFHILQTLKKRRASGVVEFHRGEELVKLEIEAVPVRFEEFPPSILTVPERVRLQTEINDPTVSLLAEELWEQFAMGAYGTAVYETMLDDDDRSIDIWAAALHQAMNDSLSGGDRSEREAVLEAYGITDELRFRFEQAYRHMHDFMKSTTPGGGD
ncbi:MULTISPECIES: hypothetical protein [unclassified Paenibacillus]|uniref:hypothetical protein n=1 Tax=unclassified Paenibacillus TaxID=185978 RepID=UPI001E63BF03|nr:MULTISPECIES: hypothetical protein [unclassified Paenibacillus]